jgi:hypothetical protein
MYCCAAGLTSLRELALDGNRLTGLAPLASLTGLEVLLAAHNHLSSCEGVQVGLSLSSTKYIILCRLHTAMLQLRRCAGAQACMFACGRLAHTTTLAAATVYRCIRSRR